MSKIFLKAFSVFILLSLFPGCSYKMGSPVSGGSHLHIRVKNDSVAPLLGAKVDRELRKNILRNGSYVLANGPGDADVFLIVTLTNYEDSTEAYRPGDTLLAAGLNLRISATVELNDVRGVSMHQENVRADSSVLRSISQVPDDSMALQALAERLASNISLSLLNQAW